MDNKFLAAAAAPETKLSLTKLLHGMGRVLFHVKPLSVRRPPPKNSSFLPSSSLQALSSNPTATGKGGKVKFDFFIGSKAKQLPSSPCSHSGAGGFGDPTLGSSSRLRMWEKIQPCFSPALLAASWLIPPGGAAWPGSLSPPFITEHLFHLPPSCACIKPLLILLSEASQLIGINLIGVTTELMFAGVRENSWLWREIKSNFTSSRFAWGWRVPFPSWKELLQSHSPGKMQVGGQTKCLGQERGLGFISMFYPRREPWALSFTWIHPPD